MTLHYAFATDVEPGNEEAYKQKVCNEKQLYLLSVIHVCGDTTLFTTKRKEIHATSMRPVSDNDISNSVL